MDDEQCPKFGAEMTKADLYALGLTGRKNSAEKRKMLQQAYALPEHMSANALLQVLNILTTREELECLLSVIE